MGTVTIQVHPLSPAALGLADGGKINDQFAEWLAAFLQAARDHDDARDSGGVYQTSDGCLKATLTLNVELVYNVERNTSEASASVVTKMPKLKPARVALRIDDDGDGKGRFLVESDDSAAQMKLVPSKSRLQGDKE